MQTTLTVERTWRALKVRIEGTWWPEDEKGVGEFDAHHVWFVNGLDTIDFDEHVDECDAWGEISEIAVSGLSDDLDAHEYLRMEVEL